MKTFRRILKQSELKFRNDTIANIEMNISDS